MYNDLLNVEIHSITHDDWHSAEPASNAFAAQIKYDKPGFVTEILTFGDDEAEFSHMWHDTEREGVLDFDLPQENPLTEIKYKRNE